MEDLSPEVLATVVAENFGDSYGSVINAVMREDLAHRVERALREALVADRKAAAALCLEREALWVAPASAVLAWRLRSGARWGSTPLTSRSRPELSFLRGREEIPSARRFHLQVIDQRTEDEPNGSPPLS